MTRIDGTARQTIAVAIAMGATLAMLAACAQSMPGSGTDGSSGGPTSSPASDPDPVTELGVLPEPLPTGEVLAQGTVLGAADGAPTLCLGVVAESYPPQCSGPAVGGWDWESVDGWEEASGMRFGAYVLQGTWDGVELTATGTPMLLALYDPAPIDATPPPPGTTDVATLTAIQQTLQTALGDDLVESAPVDGRLDATVVYDDGTLQEHLDTAYGPNVVRVTSALRDVSTP